MTGTAEPSTASSPAVPLPLRVAAGLCAAVGILSLFGALMLSLPLAGHTPWTWIPLGVNTTAALLMCLAAVMVWKRRKLGVGLVVLAWARPTIANLLAGESVRGPSLLMVLALITLATNWSRLH